MTIRTRVQLNSDADTYLPTNGAGGITAEDVRQRVKDLADSARLKEDRTYRTISGADTIIGTDYGKLVVATAGTFTLALTAAATLGQYFGCDVLNAGSGIVTLDANSTETINGAATQVLFPGDSAELVCTGSAWYAVVHRAAAIVTPWVAYTPVCTGLGTPTGLNFRSRRNGGNLEVIGGGTSGTSTAVEGRITLGFNGTSGNVTSASWLPTLTPVGLLGLSLANAAGYRAYIEPSVGYLTFGAEAIGGLTKETGSGIFGTGRTFALQVSVPIDGWS